MRSFVDCGKCLKNIKKAFNTLHVHMMKLKLGTTIYVYTYLFLFRKSSFFSFRRFLRHKLSHWCSLYAHHGCFSEFGIIIENHEAYFIMISSSSIKFHEALFSYVLSLYIKFHTIYKFSVDNVFMREDDLKAAKIDCHSQEREEKKIIFRPSYAIFLLWRIVIMIVNFV